MIISDSNGDKGESMASFCRKKLELNFQLILIQTDIKQIIKRMQLTICEINSNTVFRNLTEEFLLVPTKEEMFQFTNK